jgi:hypothetical protein
MDSQELNIIGNRAKSETEAFINRHFNDRAKGWPTTCLNGPNYTDYCREEQFKNVKYQECS